MRFLDASTRLRLFSMRSLGDIRLRPVLAGCIRGSVTLFVLASVLLPPLPPKKLFFLTTFLLAILYFSLFGVRRSSVVVNPFIVVTIFTAYLFYGMFGSSDYALGVQFLNVSFSLFLVVVVSELKIDLEKIMIHSSLLLSAVIIYMSAGYFSSITNLTLPGVAALIDYYKANELGYLGTRNFGDFQPVMLHFVSSPLLLIPFLLLFAGLLKKFSFYGLVSLLLVGTAISVSGSRGIFLFSLIGMLCLYLNQARPTQAVSVVVFILAVGGFFVVEIFDEISQAFSTTETSNSIKIGHFRSFLHHVNAQLVVFGEGLASTYFSSGANAVRAQTEVTMLDFLRYFGLIGTLIVLGVLLFPIRVRLNPFEVRLITYRGRSTVFIVYSLYLLMSFTNPILLNSFGILAVLWCWSRLLDVRCHENHMYYRYV